MHYIDNLLYSWRYDIYSLEGKEIMYFGEVWHDGNNFEILGRASFEIKII
ncbi:MULTISPECIES: hypothetical protein [Oceanotoga]|uniref:Uncharacterized protein n=1 Tax=Oceanotoga teriensis TaxID=515440 RepID=A0AA45HIU4_9BACT|nr:MULTISPECIES: hypothetical protein [Oceanotoga]MDO7975967.1 hypothetical protein [Oceanotoga teriensis]PWJ95048.1 hypothetical protein C7380_1073 [Oceanotoga teriensis]